MHLRTPLRCLLGRRTVPWVLGVLLLTPGCELLPLEGQSFDTSDAPETWVEADGGVDGSNGGFVLNAEEAELYRLINAYRAERGLPAIALSPSLTTVARAHVQDHIANAATLLVGGCNLHSWSNSGAWQGCCYTADHAQAACMWNKPRELTVYPGNGYEISVSGAFSAAEALSSWQGSPGHDNVIINQGGWTEPWRAIGVGIGGGYAHVWFGNEADPQ